jgi:hypothetical protein
MTFDLTKSLTDRGETPYNLTTKIAMTNQELIDLMIPCWAAWQEPANDF